MSNTDAPNVIEVEDLSKYYRLGVIGGRTLRDDVNRWWAKLRGRPDPLLKVHQQGHGNVEGENLWALRDISFAVPQGQILGIIGKNGAGKSTLLKILSRITAPTSGEVRISGRTGSLLEVGTGFHPELTGRENVYLNGSILGMKREEIDRKFDEIVDFSGVEEFIDTPVKRYSSGMRVRLGFAVAAHLDPEILIVDEVLAVGDVAFQKKCIGKMDSVASTGRTVIFVSHQMDMIRSLCQRCIWLDGGRIVQTGPPREVVSAYIDDSIETVEENSSFHLSLPPTHPIQVVSGAVRDSSGAERSYFDVFEEIRLELVYDVHKPSEGGIVNFELSTSASSILLSFDSDTDPDRLSPRRPGRYQAVISIPAALLKPGQYSITVKTGVVRTSTWQMLDRALTFEVKLLSRPSGFVSFSQERPGAIALPLHWETERVEQATVLEES